MRTRLVLLTVAFIVCSGREATAKGTEGFSVNGLTVIVAPNPATDIIAANMYFREGSARLDPRQAGIERLTLVVATKATKKYPKNTLSAALERMDTRLGANAGRDYASVTLQCVKENFAKSWDIFADVILNPLFDSSDVELERQQMLAAIRQSRDNPDQYLQELVMNAFYAGHPYSVPPNGTEQSVRSLSKGDLQEFIKSHATASQMLLVVVGNTSRAEVESMARASFAGLPQGSYAPVQLPAGEHQAPSIKIVQRKLPTNYIVGYFSAPSYGSEQSYAMTIAGSILSDRVFEEVRTKRGLSYAPNAGIGPLFDNYGQVYVTAVKPETTITVMLNEVKKLQSEPVSEKTLNDKKNGFLTRYYLNMETNQSQVEFLARYELCGAGYKQADLFVQHIKSVTPEIIQKCCKDYMRNLQFVLLGNPSSLKLADFFP